MRYAPRATSNALPWLCPPTDGCFLLRGQPFDFAAPVGANEPYNQDADPPQTVWLFTEQAWVQDRLRVHQPGQHTFLRNGA